MIVLAFHGADGGHDSSAAVVCDGRLVAAAEEERFSRIKHDGSLPHRAIDYCLRQAGVSIADVDCLVYPNKPYRSGPDAELAGADYAFLQRLVRDGRLRRRTLLHKRLLDVGLRAGAGVNLQMRKPVAHVFAALRDRYGSLPPVRFVGHHEAHAAAAFLTSKFDRAAIVTADGRGGYYATAAWSACDNAMKQTAAEPYYNSLGLYYMESTAYVGLGAFGEGKAMGLAAYGDPRTYAAAVERMLHVGDSQSWYRYERAPSPEILGFARRTGEPILDGPYADFAAAVQHAFERAMTVVTRSAIERASSTALCLSGGASLNCSANGALAAAGVSTSTWVFPAASDAGLPVGAALLTAARAGECERVALTNAYLGPEFTDEAYLAAVRGEPRVKAHRCADVAAATADLLAGGTVVGWFQGRMELGPRALGNRSILADPRTAGMRDRVNRIKRRELWRPLAPVVLAHRADEYFLMREPSPFMLFAVPVRPLARERAPAIVHVDGSARPQTVSRDQNARLCALIEAFDRRTGVPVLLNTSFNDAGEPIVCTPADAIRTLLATDLDVLVLGDFLVRRAEGDFPEDFQEGQSC